MHFRFSLPIINKMLQKLLFIVLCSTGSGVSRVEIDDSNLGTDGLRLPRSSHGKLQMYIIKTKYRTLKYNVIAVDG